MRQSIVSIHSLIPVILEEKVVVMVCNAIFSNILVASVLFGGGKRSTQENHQLQVTDKLYHILVVDKAKI
jgi:hypothetical protein